jgi:hypothetical protein
MEEQYGDHSATIVGSRFGDVSQVGNGPLAPKVILPKVLSFDAGWDAGITKRVTLSGDLIGTILFRDTDAYPNDVHGP